MKANLDARSSLPPITEIEVASHVNLAIAEQVRCEWPAIYKNFKKVLHGKFEQMDELRAAQDLCLAAISLNLRPLYTYYPIESACRIKRNVLEHISLAEGFGPDSANEVITYSEVFDNELRELGAGGYPLGNVALRLLRQWLGATNKDLDADCFGELLALTMKTLSSVADFWKNVHADFELVQTEVSHGQDDVYGSEANCKKPKLFVVTDEPAVLEVIASLLSKSDCEFAGSLSLRGHGWAFEEVLSDAIAFQPNVLMFCINCHLCPLVDSVDIPRMLIREFPEARIVVTRNGDYLNIREDTRRVFDSQRRYLHVIDYPVDKYDLSAALWPDNTCK
jgi:hypothetical protein